MTSKATNENALDIYLVANLTDSVDRLRYTYKTHEKAASRYQRYEAFRKWALIIFTVLAAGSFIASIFALAGHEAAGTVIVGLVATLATFASFLGDYLDYPDRQQEHHIAGAKARSLFVRYEDLLSDYLAGAIASSEARRLRDDLQEATDQLLLTVPRTTRSDYKEAEAGIENDERTSVAQEAALQVLLPLQPHQNNAEVEG